MEQWMGLVVAWAIGFLCCWAIANGNRRRESYGEQGERLGRERR